MGSAKLPPPTTHPYLPPTMFAFYVEPLGPISYITLLSNDEGD